MRNHPAINYYRSGLPIVLAGDDPGSFGYNHLTLDYYFAYLSWGFNIIDLRTVANNSIRYSLLNDDEKKIGYEKFSKKWNEFIDQTYKKACNQTDKNQDFMSSINFTEVLPKIVPTEKQAEISVYGSGFHNLFCRQIYCVYDKTKVSEGYISSIREIKCRTPLGLTDKANLSIRIGKNHTIQTHFEINFISNLQIIYEDELSNAHNKKFSFFHNFAFVILFSFFTFS